MVKYECPRCGFTTGIKTKYIKHLKRKFKCEPVNSNIDIDEILEKIEGNFGKNNNNNVDTSVSQELAKVSQSENIKKDIMCKYCGKKFMHFSSRTKHEKFRCKEMKKLCTEKTKKDEKYIVQVNPFGQTDTSHLTDKDYLEAIRKGNMGIPYIIEQIYFNLKKKG